jgi:hypothetical protein
MNALPGETLEQHLYQNDVSFADTTQICSHNAFASVELGWDVHAMQYDNIWGQFKNGARCFMIDVHEQNELIVLGHNANLLKIAGIGGSSIETLHPFTLKRFFVDLKHILDAYPSAIITLMIENKGVSHTSIVNVLTESRLDNAAQTTNPNVLTTFGEIRNSNRRLIIFAEEGEYISSSTPQIFSTKFYKETTYSLEKDEKCVDRREGRADFSNHQIKIFVLNHFYTKSCTHANYGFIKTPCEMVNDYHRLHNRIQQCKSSHGITPTFLALDFISLGKNGGALKLVAGIDTMPPSTYTQTSFLIKPVHWMKYCSAFLSGVLIPAPRIKQPYKMVAWVISAVIILLF